ncbi:GNAT family N-acetyltransferase [Anaeromicropila herbilytica]|uniref:Aminoglycoside N(6')-acetyltransferase n=1 Tax=Anaeromicropila herbilytica TaxID=2785025 RepID=A0A7R7EQ48_9FIRM|nr:GNAT family protein [Anaeromicropila herbilytica]BCN32983.1 aminoglycoside N(6')-acetyltransferase [Anaeromicropila herbilytica]
MKLMKLMNYTMTQDDIQLRLIELIDKETYYEECFAFEDEDVRFYTGTSEHFTKDQIDKYIDRIIPDDTRYDYLILNDSKRMVGEVVLNDIDEESKRANLRICLFRKEFFGKGYGSKALHLIIKFAFETLKLHRVELEVFEYNQRAKHCYEKVGFVMEGVKRDGLFYEGKYYNVITMAMLESDYKK